MKHLHLTDELQEQASLYAAGAMPDEERREYARHLEEDGCKICLNEARELQGVAGLMTLGLKQEAPSAAVKSRLMARAPLEAADPPRRWIIWLAALEAVAASVLVVMLFRDNSELRSSAQFLRTQISQLESRLAEQQQMMATLTSSDVAVTTLAGQGTTPSARARLFWDQGRNRWIVYVNNLPPVPADRSYQLWFVPTAGNPVSAGVFNTEPDGSAVVEANVPLGVQLMAAAVTTEPAGGVPQPTGAFALLGALN